MFDAPELLSGQVQSFDKVYEPSGVVQAQTGEVVVVEDDSPEPIYFTQIQGNSSGALLKAGDSFAAGTSIDDLEGLTAFPDSTLYAITSHSLTKGKKKRKTKREKLLKLSITNNQITLMGEYGSLQPHIVNKLRLTPGIKEGFEDLINIEGLSSDSSGKKLLIGLRLPTINGKAVILEILNPDELFTNNKPPIFSDRLLLLDLGGAGIRAMEYFPQMNRYFLSSEISNNKGKKRSKVWEWDGVPESTPIKVDLPKFKGAKNIEGIAPIQHSDGLFLLLVFDDGDSDKKKGAHYVLIEADRIESIAP